MLCVLHCYTLWRMTFKFCETSKLRGRPLIERKEFGGPSPGIKIWRPFPKKKIEYPPSGKKKLTALLQGRNLSGLAKDFFFREVLRGNFFISKQNFLQAAPRSFMDIPLASGGSKKLCSNQISISRNSLHEMSVCTAMQNVPCHPILCIIKVAYIIFQCI